MSPRLVGSILALLAIALLAVSIVTSAWWAGPPEVDGRVMHKKEVFVGLLGAKGCNTGGDGSCEPLPLPAAFETTGYVVLGATGLVALAGLLMALLSLAGSDRRKAVSTVVLIAVGLAGAAAVALIVQGPKVMAGSRSITVPIGYGLYLFGGGLVAAVLGSLLARRPTPKLELRGSRQAIAPNLAPPPTRPQPVDVLAFAQQPPPSAQPAPHAFDPRMHPAPMPLPSPAPISPAAFAMAAPPPQPPPAAGFAVTASAPTRPPEHAMLPGGMLPGPAGPLGVGPQPGQYRPLYEVDQALGGTGGFVPPTPAASTMSPGAAPAPPPRRSASAPPPVAPIAAMHGPAPSGPLMPPRPSPPVPSASVRAGLPGIPAPRTKAASIVPPPRAKAPSLTPAARTKLPGMGAPMPKPTTIGVVAPPPGLLAAFKIPVRADTDPSDQLETMDRDAMTIAREAPDVQIGSPRADAAGEPEDAAIGDSTDASISLPEGARAQTSSDDDETSAREKSDPEDDETVARDKVELEADAPEAAARAKPDPTDQQATVPRDSASDIETVAHERVSASTLDTGSATSAVERIEPATAAMPPAPTAPAPTPPAAPAPTAAPAPAASASAASPPTASPPLAASPSVADAGRSSPKIPVSTAPDSLPPPAEAQEVSSGPTPACPQCEAPMGWVEEHLRFYCKSCRMYF